MCHTQLHMALCNKPLDSHQSIPADTQSALQHASTDQSHEHHIKHWAAEQLVWLFDGCLESSSWEQPSATNDVGSWV